MLQCSKDDDGCLSFTCGGEGGVLLLLLYKIEWSPTAPLEDVATVLVPLTVEINQPPSLIKDTKTRGWAGLIFI